VSNLCSSSRAAPPPDVRKVSDASVSCLISIRLHPKSGRSPVKKVDARRRGTATTAHQTAKPMTNVSDAALQRVPSTVIARRALENSGSAARCAEGLRPSVSAYYLSAAPASCAYSLVGIVAIAHQPYFAKTLSS